MTAPDAADLKRDQILAAASRVIAERGYHATNIADIARELGAGHGTFYRYFKNKHDIAVQAVDRAMRRIAEALADEPPEVATSLDEYRAQVTRIAHRLFDLVIAEPVVARLFFFEAAAINRERAERFHAALDDLGSFTAAYIRNGQRRGFLRAEVDPEVIGLALNGVILAGAARMLRVSDPAAERDRWVDSVLTLMFHGLAS
ncbi:TetR/AcrR family transcriptional regulator [Gandjariella thermophila]|uniref:Putative transcriptional regulator, TetR family protein n=1 Tax=Gandjariella thermophila TaxID=1931992 RepID=A0A4D4JHK3_9PSEU|nr:TetR/AcrR family transcriptional regulator [Gandjariella thermophila]GDY33876.1 putative transcriptional regulator, TetR family protein [Gandjariella thermophila]